MSAMINGDSMSPEVGGRVIATAELGAGIVDTVGANLAHGVGYGPVGALVSACRCASRHTQGRTHCGNPARWDLRGRPPVRTDSAGTDP